MVKFIFKVYKKTDKEKKKNTKSINMVLKDIKKILEEERQSFVEYINNYSII